MKTRKVDFIYECISCGRHYPASEIIYLCPVCSRQNTVSAPMRGVLKLVYDYAAIRSRIHGIDDLARTHFHDLLPVAHSSSWPPLRTGNTPLYLFSELEGKKLPFKIYLKDDSQNPTFSLKDRASALVSAFAHENNLPVIVAASTGNAGSSIAGICASHKQKAVVFVPASAPPAKLTQIAMYGAKLVPVAGTYDEAFELSIRATRQFGWYNRNTAFNPLTIEGKKTAAFEIFTGMGNRVPDRILVPTGDGVILSSVYKGFEELVLLGLADRMPVITAVQAEGSDNLVRNLNSEYFKVIKSSTIADSISVDIPCNFIMSKQYSHKYHGESITVSDDEIVKASAILAKNTGLFTEPAGAAAFAALISMMGSGRIAADSENVVLLTGSGLKDITPLRGFVKMQAPVEPSVEDLSFLVR